MGFKHRLPTVSKPGEKSFWHNLPGAGLPLQVAGFAEKAQKPLVIVSPNINSAALLASELGFFAACDVRLFPDWETLPYDNVSPHQDIISSRLDILAAFPFIKSGIVVMSAESLVLPVPARDYILANSFTVAKGRGPNYKALLKRLENSAYCRVNQVMEHGEYAVRGEIIDIYPMGRSHALRLEFCFDELENIRQFDLETQSSIAEVNAAKIMAAREFAMDETGIRNFISNWRNEFGPEAADPVLYAVQNGNAPAGIEYYLPWFFTGLNSIIDYFPQDAVVISTGDISKELEAVRADFDDRYTHSPRSEYLIPPGKLLGAKNEIFFRLNNFPQIIINSKSKGNASRLDFAAREAPPLTINHKFNDPLTNFMQFVNTFTGRILFVIDSAARRELLQDLLSRRNVQLTVIDTISEFWSLSAKYVLIKGYIEQGVIFNAPEIAIISESHLFGTQSKEKALRAAKFSPHDAVKNLGELQINDPVVHIDNGVGRYRGLKNIEAGGQLSEYLILEYFGGDILYVPATSLDTIHRYSGADRETAPLHKLGGRQWEKLKKRARERAYDAAARLLEIYAKRAASFRPGMSNIDEQFRIFSAEFSFELTPDQENTINTIIADMQGDKPMDRLVCGDVGFGKTEVAMRAAFLAVLNRCQVAVLTPTTLLAQQHFETFSERFDGWPVNIRMVSRFQNRTEISAVLREMSAGGVDIVIGTHRLLSKDIVFKNLGLLIIDEEHRFGVRHKDKFKSLRANVDILALTATPIPRTLHLSLSGIRDLSVIATAPKSRVAIKTSLHEWDEELIIESCRREMRRGGQIYFVHNKVKTINNVADEIGKLLPNAKIGVAHGQMREIELEHIMRDFYHNRYNVLVCSAIIENGIDIPNANTIIINRADRLGLAQLYQLRGRVGRSHHRAYAYLMVESLSALTDSTRKRLDTICSMQELGVGFTLATRDMEIRGAGELLGEEQSGQIHDIGFEMFSKILTQAVEDLTTGVIRDNILENEPLEVELDKPALIPETYLPDVNTRLVLYKRISGCVSVDELDELRMEIHDRFGKPPVEIDNLFTIARLKLILAPRSIKGLEAGNKEIIFRFGKSSKFDPAKIINLVRDNPDKYRMKGNNSLTVSFAGQDLVAEVGKVLETI